MFFPTVAQDLEMAPKFALLLIKKDEFLTWIILFLILAPSFSDGS
jgi:hypothetical protein